MLKKRRTTRSKRTDTRFPYTTSFRSGLLSRARVLQPKAEAEIAIVLGKDITSANATAADIYAATDHVVAAIEIVDSRIADWKITFADTVADNGSSAFYVLGREPRDRKSTRLNSSH